jgi:cation diffusion facilitator family transporter
MKDEPQLTTPPAEPSQRQDPEAQQKSRLRMILLSFLVSLALTAIKFWSFYITHSSAVLSDALESIINVVASAFATLSIWMAAKPPDPEHPYGHGKIEYFSAGFEGALIVCAALGIFYTGIGHLLNPHELPHLQQGVLLLAGATAVNLLLGVGLLSTGKRTSSITLIADGKHIIADVYTSGAVIIGLVLVQWTGWIWLDGAIACMVGINILVTGGRLVHQSFSRLMDASDPVLLDQITDCLEEFRRPAWVDIHQLRAWRAGNLIHIDLHLVLPDDLILEEAHDEAQGLETLLIDHFHGNASVLVHMDPCSSTHCPACQKDPCTLRSEQLEKRSAWHRGHLIRSRRNPGTRSQGNRDNPSAS